MEQDDVMANPDDLEAQTRSRDNGLSPLYVNFEGRWSIDSWMCLPSEQDITLNEVPLRGH